MVVRSEKNRIKTLVTDTITLLCRNGLQTKSGFSIDGVIGVTSLDDEDDVFLISIKEIIKNIPEKAASSDSEEEEPVPHKRKRKQPHKNVESDSELNQDRPSSRDTFSPASQNIKREVASDSDSNDLVMVKEEPSRQSQRQLHATQVPQNEAHAINSAISNMGQLSQVQSFKPPAMHQMPNLPHLPPWQNSPRPRTIVPTTHISPLAQQQQAAMQGYVTMKKMYSPSGTTEDFSRYTEDDMRTIANRIASSEGMFLTVRLVKRRVCRYPTNFIIKTMKEYMNRTPDDPLYMGEYREPPRTKVFYKCPPELIKPQALQTLGVARETYAEMFHNVPKVQKWDKPEIQGRLLMSVIEASPYNTFYKSDVVKKYSSWGRSPVVKQENWLQKIAMENAQASTKAPFGPLSIDDDDNMNGDSPIDMTKEKKERETSSPKSVKTEDLVSNTSAAVNALAALTERPANKPAGSATFKDPDTSSINNSSALASLYAFAGAQNPFDSSDVQVDMQKQAEKAIMQNFYTRAISDEEDENINSEEGNETACQ